MSKHEAARIVRKAPSGRALPAPSAFAAHWDLDPKTVFLNHGSFGATPRVVLEKQNKLRALMEHEPVRFFIELRHGLLDRANAFVASMLNADVEGLVHVPNATAGVNTVLRSLEFSPGDELLTSTHEYNACNNTLEWAAQRSGARVVYASPAFPGTTAEKVVESIVSAITPRTRLVLVSHVTSPTGLIFPVEAIVRACEARGVDVLIDGAHAPGMVPIDLARLKPAYYAGNFHKWVCAPKGAAFLWAREDNRERLRPLSISHGANENLHAGKSRLRAEFDYTGTNDDSAYLCVETAAGFLAGLIEGGLAGLVARNHAMTLEARDVLCNALQVEPPAPDDMLGSMAAVPLPNPKPGKFRSSARGYHDALQDALIERHALQVPIVPFPPGPTGAPGSQRFVRVSMQAYNTIEQVEYLGECLRAELGREGG